MKKTNLTATEKANLEARHAELTKEIAEINDKIDCLPIARMNWVVIMQTALEEKRFKLDIELTDLTEILYPPTEDYMGCWCRMAGRRFRDEHPEGYRYNEIRDGMEIWKLL